MFLPFCHCSSSSEAARCGRVGVQLLEKWFTKHGGFIHPDIEIGRNVHGLCLQVRKGKVLQDATTVISCPHKVTISVLNFEHESTRWPLNFVKSDKSSPEVLTRFFLMEQMAVEGTILLVAISGATTAAILQ